MTNDFWLDDYENENSQEDCQSGDEADNGETWTEKAEKAVPIIEDIKESYDDTSET